MTSRLDELADPVAVIGCMGENLMSARNRNAASWVAQLQWNDGSERSRTTIDQQCRSSYE